MAITPERLDFLRRNSRIRLDKEGRWSMDNKPVEHPRVQRLFHQGVRPSDEPGRYTLHVGQQWAWIEFIDDVAYFVERAIPRGAQIELVLAGGHTETLDPTTLSSPPERSEDVYCVLANGHRARLLRGAVAALIELIEERSGAVGLHLGDEFFEIASE